MKGTRNTYLALLTVVLLPIAARADVIYEFTAFSSFEFDGETILSAEFSLITSDFITSPTSIDLIDMLSCSVVSSLGTNQCGLVTIFNPRDGDEDRLEFGAILGGVFWDVYYIFEDGAFGSEGTYSTVRFDERQEGQLVVTKVPEPGTLALLGIGLAAMGLSRRRKKV